MSYKSDRFLDKTQKIASIAASIVGCVSAAKNLGLGKFLLSAMQYPISVDAVTGLFVIVLLFAACNLVFRIFFAAISAVRDFFSSILYRINYGGRGFNFYRGLDYHFSTGYRRYSRSPLLFTLLILAAIAFTFHIDSRKLADNAASELPTNGAEIIVTPSNSASYE